MASKEEELLAELLDESSSFAQEMTVRQKQEIRIMCKILFMSAWSKSKFSVNLVKYWPKDAPHTLSRSGAILIIS